MKDKELDAALEQIKNKQVPACPPNLETNVWRRIRRKQSTHVEEEQLGVFIFINWILGRQVMMPAIALTIIFSILTTGLSVKNTMMENRNEVNVSALGFDVFTSKPSLNLNTALDHK